ncbi:hypothetical protein GGI11_008614 [Coemansia sp. RSA 2049]|nr:hypothetical protein GGI11_008614 [Coemansia sp. RSA 2049]
MEKFKEAVESQTFALGCLDTHPSYCTTPLYFFYKNGNIDGQFMPPDLLKDSFFEALRVFPILAGCLHMKNGGIDASINVDRNNINMPVYGEYDSDIHFDKIEAANFSWDALPKEISKPGFVLRKGKDNIIKLAEIEIARLQANSGLVILVNIAHVVMDVNGIVKFLHYWAQLCRQMSLGNLDAKFAEQSTALYHQKHAAK